MPAKRPVATRTAKKTTKKAAKSVAKKLVHNHKDGTLWAKGQAIDGLLTGYWEWFRKDPIIDVRMFKSFNFAAANLMMFMMGFMLFSTLVLIPEFLQTLTGYTAELAGLVLSGGGVVLLVMMPITGRLTSKIQARHLIAMGWLCLAV